MKRLLLVLTTFTLMIPLVRASESLQYTVNIDYSGIEIGTVTHSSGEVFSTIEVPGMYNSTELNEPKLPESFITFEVPAYVNNFRTSVQSYVFQRTIKLNNPILPSEAIPTNGTTASSLGNHTYGARYLSDINEPLSEVVDEYFLNGNQHFIVIRVCPLVYHHSSKTVDLFNKLNIRIEYSDCDKKDIKFTPYNTNGFQNIHRPDVTVIVERNSELESNNISPQETDDISNYIIIIPDNLTNGILRFADWKRQKGYNVTIQTVEGILTNPNFCIDNNPSCFDKESSIREWMRNQYYKQGAFFCLIVGDFRTNAPIRKYKFPSVIKSESFLGWNNPNTDEYIPSDVYFADLVTNWEFELSPAGIYVSDITKASMSPTIPVGRLLCWNESQIQNFTDKVITYEMNPGLGDASYLNNGFVVKHQDFFKTYRTDYPTLFSYTDKYKVETLKSNYADIHAKLRPLSSDVIAGMSKAGLYSLQGHGSPTGISVATVAYPDTTWPCNRNILALEEYKNPLYGTDWDNGGGLDMLNNGGKPAIAYSWACTIAPFDNRPDRVNGEFNMASSFTVSGSYGGPAMLANTRQGWFGNSNIIEENFARHIEDFLSIGILENLSKIEYPASSPHAKFSKFTHNIIGDSELKIWNNVPSYMVGEISIRNGIFCFNGNAARYAYGVSGQSKMTRQTFHEETGAFSIDLSDETMLGVIYVESDKYLPTTFLVSGNLPLDYNAGNFNFRNVRFADKSTENSESFDVGNFPNDLRVDKYGKIKISATDYIEAQGGIEVTNGGCVILECDRNVKLSDISISNGGAIQVESRTLELDGGFYVPKGSTFSMVSKCIKSN